MRTILLTPLVTEKAMAATKQNAYGFVVLRSATKHQVKETVQSLFKVDVLDIRTMTAKGKTKRVGKRRTTIFHAPVKKAIVTIKKGQTIDVVPTAPEEKAHETAKQ